MKTIQRIAMLLFAAFMLASCTEKYNGDIMHDAKVMHNKIFKQKMSIDGAIREYAVVEGYGMRQANYVFREVVNMPIPEGFDADDLHYDESNLY